MKKRLLHIRNWVRNNKKAMVIFFLINVFLKVAFWGWLILSFTKCSAQSTNTLLRDGNKYYAKEKYNNATESYSKALLKAPKDVRANFNQGDAFFKLNELDKAKDQYLAAARLSKNTDIQAKAYYNVGNAWYKQEKWEESAKAYKTSLKLNPKDEQAKYNLMMALSKIKKNGGGGGKDNQKDKKKQDQKQDQKKDQQQNGKNDPKQDQQGQNPQDKQQQQKKEQQQGQVSSEEAQKLLDAIQGEETKVQQKLAKDKTKPQNTKVQKDW